MAPPPPAATVLPSVPLPEHGFVCLQREMALPAYGPQTDCAARQLCANVSMEYKMRVQQIGEAPTTSAHGPAGRPLPAVVGFVLVRVTRLMSISYFRRTVARINRTGMPRIPEHAHFRSPSAVRYCWIAKCSVISGSRAIQLSSSRLAAPIIDLLPPADSIGYYNAIK